MVEGLYSFFSFAGLPKAFASTFPHFSCTEILGCVLKTKLYSQSVCLELDA